MKYAILALILSATSASAQASCAPRDQLVKYLADDWNETPQVIGMTDAGGLMEVFGSSEGTWTIVLTGPNGVSCIALSGDNYEAVNQPLGELN